MTIPEVNRLLTFWGRECARTVHGSTADEAEFERALAEMR